MNIAHLSPTELSEQLKHSGADSLFLLDVREPEEHALCRIDGSCLIPMGEISNRLSEIPRDRPIVCICHHGGRSLRVAQHLSSAGFENLINLTGGVHRWALEVDPSMPTYP